MEASPALPEEQGTIAQLLRSTFGPDLPASLISPELLQWKYFSQRPGWTGSRSYVLREERKIQAHACVWPIAFLSAAGEVPAVHVIDWMARPEAKGAGSRLYRSLLEQGLIVLGIGGSAATRNRRAKLGFQPCGTLDVFARVIRPWRQYLSRPQRGGIRGLARLARNIQWSLPQPTASDGKWTATAIVNPRDLPEAALRLPASSFSPGVRSPEWIRYFLSCPAVNGSLFALAKSGRPCGHFLLNQVQGQCRIVELEVDSELPEDWESAYRLALRTAAAQEETCEVVAVSSLPWLSDRLRRMGFRLRKQTPVWLNDPQRRLLDQPPLLLQMTDNDSCFFYSAGDPFLT